MATRKTRAAPITEAPTETKVIAYKGFNPDWTCNPNGVAFQYEVGKTYTHDGKVEACASGFHACEMPLDVWNYYKPNSSKFAVVEAAGKIARHDGKDSKIASATITVQAEIKLPDLIKRAVQWVLDRARSNTATGDYGHAAATGHSGHAAATGRSGHAAATGYSGHAAATGYSGHAAATGDYGHAAATGDSGHAAATGNSSHAAATGNSGHAAATGNYGHAAATGHSGHAAATGYSSHAAATGYSSHAAATGDYGHAAATGNYGHAAATGRSGHAAATGGYGCAFAGFGGRAKASINGSFAIAWRDESTDRARLIVGTPGENGIKPDTFYRVVDGALVEE